MTYPSDQLYQGDVNFLLTPERRLLTEIDLFEYLMLDGSTEPQYVEHVLDKYSKLSNALLIQGKTSELMHLNARLRSFLWDFYKQRDIFKFIPFLYSEIFADIDNVPSLEALRQRFPGIEKHPQFVFMIAVGQCVLPYFHGTLSKAPEKLLQLRAAFENVPPQAFMDPFMRGFLMLYRIYLGEETLRAKDWNAISELIQSAIDDLSYFMNSISGSGTKLLDFSIMLIRTLMELCIRVRAEEEGIEVLRQIIDRLETLKYFGTDPQIASRLSSIYTIYIAVLFETGQPDRVAEALERFVSFIRELYERFPYAYEVHLKALEELWKYDADLLGPHIIEERIQLTKALKVNLAKRLRAEPNSVPLREAKDKVMRWLAGPSPREKSQQTTADSKKNALPTKKATRPNDPPDRLTIMREAAELMISREGRDSGYYIMMPILVLDASLGLTSSVDSILASMEEILNWRWQIAQEQTGWSYERIFFRISRWHEICGWTALSLLKDYGQAARHFRAAWQARFLSARDHIPQDVLLAGDFSIALGCFFSHAWYGDWTSAEAYLSKAEEIFANAVRLAQSESPSEPAKSLVGLLGLRELMRPQPYITSARLMFDTSLRCWIQKAKRIWIYTSFFVLALFALLLGKGDSVIERIVDKSPIKRIKGLLFRKGRWKLLRRYDRLYRLMQKMVEQGEGRAD